MPTSMEIVCESFSDNFSLRDKKYPNKNPKKCNSIMAAIKGAPISRIASFFAARMKFTMKTMESTARKGV